MAIGVALCLLVVGVAIGYQQSVGKSAKRKKIVWGITFMVAVAPFFSWLVGIGYGVSVGDGFAAAGVMVILFPIFFLGGLIALLMGIFGKEK
ncbi:hypothetical protein [Mesobacillus maritimus]|uniref:hypothetical protein n=1 Tax=Mesobacillus maritimus TaxID=1643336 RepID=UPI0038515324